MKSIRLEALCRKKIGILGGGMEGGDLENFLRESGAESVEVLDDGGERPIERLERYDVIFRSPGVSWHHPALKGYEERVTSAYELFLELCPAKEIVGITGTKGKGSVTHFLDQILAAAQKDHVVRGNIGKPFFSDFEEIGEESIVILELSSFQLWRSRLAPKRAVILPMSPDHQDVHHSLQEYYEAKANLWRKGGNEQKIYYRAQSKDVMERGVMPERGMKIGGEDDPLQKGDDGWICCRGERVLKSDEIPLRLPVDHENALTAGTIALEMGVEMSELRAGLTSLQPLPMRMELVLLDEEGRHYWNNSYATLPQAVVATLEGFGPGDELTLLLGGRNKGLDFSELGRVIREHPADILCVIYGEARPEIVSVLAERGVQKMREAPSLMKALEKMRAEEPLMIAPQSHLVLAPGCASFDEFQNVKDRGKKYHAWICEMAEGEANA